MTAEPMTATELEDLRMQLGEPQPLVRATAGGFTFTPAGREWLRSVCAGQARLLDEVERLRGLEADLRWLCEQHIPFERAMERESARARTERNEARAERDAAIECRDRADRQIRYHLDVARAAERERDALAAKLAAVRELHRPVNHRGIQVCNGCTSLDVLMQTMSGRGRRGVEYPCATARAALGKTGGEDQ